VIADHHDRAKCAHVHRRVASLAVHLEDRGGAQQEQYGGQAEEEAAPKQPQDGESRIPFGESELAGDSPAIAVEQNGYGEGDDCNDQKFAVGGEALQRAALSRGRASMVQSHTGPAAKNQDRCATRDVPRDTRACTQCHHADMKAVVLPHVAGSATSSKGFE